MLHISPIQYRQNSVNFTNKKKTFDEDKINSLGISNLHITNENGVRGESLAHKKNRQYIALVKDAGINQIIDLKTADYSDRFEKTVKTNGLDYHHYPIDSNVTSDREIINNLPSLFEQINKGNFYIACAQGLHRTDIAMALNYLFNVNADIDPPILYGHNTKKGLRVDDIFRRANSIYNNLTEEDIEELGLKELNNEKFKEKKNCLVEAQDFTID